MRRALIAAAVAGSVAVTGCGASGSSAARSPSSPSSAPVPALEVTDSGAGICLESVSVPTDFGYWRGALTATQGLRITAIAIGSGMGVSVHGGFGLALKRPVTVAGITHWPMSGPGVLRDAVNWPARTSLVGLHLRVGHSVLPLIHVRAEPGGQLNTVVVRYHSDGGRDGVVVLAESLRFSRATC